MRTGQHLRWGRLTLHLSYIYPFMLINKRVSAVMQQTARPIGTIKTFVSCKCHLDVLKEDENTSNWGFISSFIWIWVVCSFKLAKVFWLITWSPHANCSPMEFYLFLFFWFEQLFDCPRSACYREQEFLSRLKDPASYLTQPQLEFCRLQWQPVLFSICTIHWSACWRQWGILICWHNILHSQQHDTIAHIAPLAERNKTIQTTQQV